MACISPPSRGQPLGRILEDVDDADSITGSSAGAGDNTEATHSQDPLLQASNVLAFIYCFCAQLLRNVPQSNLTCKRSLEDSSLILRQHPESCATISYPSIDFAVGGQHDLALVPSSGASSSSLVTQTSAQLSQIMDGTNRNDRSNNGANRANRNPYRSNSEYGPSPQGWMNHPDFRPGHMFIDNYVPANGFGVFGNAIRSNDPRYRSESNAYVNNVIEGSGVLGNIPAESLPNLPRSNTVAAPESRSMRSPPSPPTRIDPLQRTESMPARSATEVQNMREMMLAAAEGRMRLNNLGGATATMVSEPESMRRPAQEPERDSFQRYGRGRSLQEADRQYRPDARR